METIFIDQPICKLCGRMFETLYACDEMCNTCLEFPPSFDEARALFQYNETSKNMVMKIKKNADNHVAKTFARMLFTRYPIVFKNADLIVPVPSHWLKIMKRGYNPAAIIASEISKISGIAYMNAMRDLKKTRQQKHKSIQERMENVAGAFICKKRLHDKNIILVDDVLTTGATLNECSKALKGCGAKHVSCLTIACTRIIQ
jgi:ComF family protein